MKALSPREDIAYISKYIKRYKLRKIQQKQQKNAKYGDQKTSLTDEEIPESSLKLKNENTGDTLQ